MLQHVALVMQDAFCFRVIRASGHDEQYQGYTNIDVTGYRWSSCARDDYCTGFEATSPSGHRVTGAVGCGLMFKGAWRAVVDAIDVAVSVATKASQQQTWDVDE